MLRLQGKKSENSIYKKWRWEALFEAMMLVILVAALGVVGFEEMRQNALRMGEQPSYGFLCLLVFGAILVITLRVVSRMSDTGWMHVRDEINFLVRQYKILKHALDENNQSMMFQAMRDYMSDVSYVLDDLELDSGIDSRKLTGSMMANARYRIWIIIDQNT